MGRKYADAVVEIAAANQESHDAWDGVLFDRFGQFRDLVIGSLGMHGDEALRVAPPPEGGRALDVGCGFGDTTRQIGALAGPNGSALGVDISERFIEASRAEAAEAGTANVSFEVADIEVTRFEPEFDYAFSRFGTMFCANPVAALRNIRGGLVPGGRLCSVVWRRKLDNPWLHRAELAVEEFLEEPTDSDEPTCGPGPFSMANADTLSEQLTIAGFEDVALRRCDLVVKIGDDLDGAIRLMMALGPAGEIIRLSGDDAERIRPELEAAIGAVLQEYVRPDGVRVPSSTWIATATAPA